MANANRKLVEKEVTAGLVTEEDLNSWDFHYQKIKETLGGCQEQKQAVIRRRILRYFGEFKLESENYFCIRMNIPEVNHQFFQISTVHLLIYGIDYLSIDRTKQYFRGYIIDVRRMDDSHFLIQFRNQKQCFKALTSKMLNINKYIPSTNLSNPMQIFTYGDKGWVQIQPYKQFIFQRKLMARYLTNFDRIQDKSTGSRTSIYYAYSEAKKKFIKSLREQLLNKDIHKSDHGNRGNYRERSRQKQHQSYANRFQYCPLYSNQRSNNRVSRIHQCICVCQHQCQCINNNQHNNNNNMFRMRNHQRSISRQQRNNSKSSRNSSIEDRNQRNPSSRSQQRLTILQAQKVKQSDFKFDIYIKNRDKNHQQTNNNKQIQHNALSFQNNQNSNNLFMNNQQNIHNSNNSNLTTKPSTNNSIVIMNPDLYYPNNQTSISKILPLPPSSSLLNKNNNNNNNNNNNKQQQLIILNNNNDNENDDHMNDSLNFQLYLQRLKLQDNSQQYSVFDLQIDQ